MKAPVRRQFRQAGDYMLPGNNPARQCDEALCRVRDGDMTGLETIYNMLGRRIYMLALSVLKDTESAKDVMQETFVRLVNGAHAYRDGSNAQAYILAVTRNLAIKLQSSRSRELSYENIDEDARGAVGIDSNKPLSALDALSLLDADDRQLVVLRLDGNMKFREIAPILGISPDACRKRYQRALSKLKTYYS